MSPSFLLKLQEGLISFVLYCIPISQDCTCDLVATQNIFTKRKKKKIKHEDRCFPWWKFLCKMDKYNEPAICKYFPFLILFGKALGNFYLLLRIMKQYVNNRLHVALISEFCVPYFFTSASPYVAGTRTSFSSECSMI